MNKAQFIELVSQTAGLSKQQANNAYEGFKAAIGAALVGGERLSLPGIGVFSVSERQARKGRNPATGQEIEIPDRRAAA
jgi:DNA-binding protein HU-beta